HSVNAGSSRSLLSRASATDGRVSEAPAFRVPLFRAIADLLHADRTRRQNRAGVNPARVFQDDHPRQNYQPWQLVVFFPYNAANSFPPGIALYSHRSLSRNENRPAFH